MATYPFDKGYCNVGDVELLFPNLELYSNLNDTRFEAVIADSAVEIDGLVSRFYLVPVTDPSGFALSYLRTINKYWAASLVHKHYFIASNSSNKSSGQAWADKAKEMIERVVPPRDPKDPKGFQPFPSVRFFGAPLQLGSELPDFPEGAAATFNSANDQDLTPDQQPFFQRTDRMIRKGGMI